MSPFDRAHTTSYSTLIDTMHLSCTVFEQYRSYLSNVFWYWFAWVVSDKIQRVVKWSCVCVCVCVSNVTYFNLPHMHPVGVTTLEFRGDLWAIMWHCLRDPILSHFDTIPAFDGQMDRQTDGHKTTDNIMLA